MIPPEVGAWYKDLQARLAFEVVAIDAVNQSIETQHEDGTVSEYDSESWAQLLLLPIPQPEDWRGAYGLDEQDALDPDQPFHPEDWAGPLSSIEPEFTHGVDDL